MSKDLKDHDRGLTEEILVKGNELVERIKNLVAEGNVRRLIIRKPNGESLLYGSTSTYFSSRFARSVS